MSDTIKVFLSYSHLDTNLKDIFVRHLNSITLVQDVTVWTDDKLHGGQRWNQEINKKLLGSQLVLLLISPDFIASEYCYNVELRNAIALERKRKAVIIPIGLKSVYYQDLAFAHLQMIPRHKEYPPFVESWPNIDEAFTEVIKQIRQSLATAIAELKKNDPYARKNEIRRDIANNRPEEARNKLIDFVNDFSENESLKDDASVLKGEYTSIIEDKKTVDYVQYRKAIKESNKEIFEVIDKVLEELTKKVIP